MRLSTLTFFVLPVLCSAQAWVPYTIEYTTTTSVVYDNGREQHTTKNLLEYRSTDGSTATYDMLNGTPASAEIWLSCGTLVSLDYGQKSAIVGKRPARHHMQIPKDQPIGTAVIAGVAAAEWPMRIQGGSGSVWVDTANDILLKVEIHVTNNGVHQDHIKEAKSVSLSAPVPNSKFEVPSGFALSAGAKATCSGS